MNCGMGRGKVNDKTQNFCKTSLGEVLKAESESPSSLNSIVICQGENSQYFHEEARGLGGGGRGR